jgi:hypothetical protein
MKREQIFTLRKVLAFVYSKGRVSKKELNEILGSSTRCDLWLEKILLKDNLLVEVEDKKGRRARYFRLSKLGFNFREVLASKECLDALCFTRGPRLSECSWAKG